MARLPAQDERRARIGPGDKVLVVPVASCKTHEGEILSVHEAGLQVRTSSGHVFLPWATTEAVWFTDHLKDEMRAFIQKRMRVRDERAQGSVIDYSLIEDAVARSTKDTT